MSLSPSQDINSLEQFIKKDIKLQASFIEIK
jgi:hypothetical protein